MITDGFVYIAALIGIAALLIYLPKIWKGKAADMFFSFAPPVVLIYLIMMVLCTLKVWDLSATAPTYSALKNPILYAMVFIMLLRCDMKKIIKLGPKMLIGFFSATLSIALGFVVAHAILGSLLGENSWQSLGALCGSWMGGGGNMLAIQAALEVSEADMAYAVVMDSVCASFYVMFLLWAIGLSKVFNKWTKADTKAIDEVGAALEAETKANTKPVTYQNIILILGMGLVVSALCQYLGGILNGLIPFFDKGTWTVLMVTVLGTVLAVTPVGKLKGIEEISNVMRALLPKSIIPVVLRQAMIKQSKKCSEITAIERANIIKALKELKFSVKKLRPIDEAIVTSGGISVKEINPKTMQSKLVQGLFFAGEVLDVDAYTGGFNLQIAFSTGYVAGLNS